MRRVTGWYVSDNPCEVSRHRVRTACPRYGPQLGDHVRAVAGDGFVHDHDRDGIAVGAIVCPVSLPDDRARGFPDLLFVTHHELYDSNLEPWELTDVIYTTAAGLARKRAELDDLVTNVLPHIAEMIGKAAAEGDLSENAEYHGWMEQRARQSQRAGRMQEDLKQARVIPPEMAGTLAVSIGSRVTARDQESGEEKDFTFLGPWDVDTDEGVYSYRAPLALAFMGRKPGETAEFDIDGRTRRFEIVSIRSAVEG